MNHQRNIYGFIGLSIIISFLLFTRCKNKPINKVDTSVFIEVLDPELGQYIDTTKTLETIAEGFLWSEGPVWVPSAKKLLFTDVPKNAIYEWSEKDGLKIWLEPSGYTQIYIDGGQEGANGLALNGDGHLILCQHGDRRLVKYKGSWVDPQPNFQVLADSFNNQRFNSPNDLFIDMNGHIFFTDPPYGLPNQDEDTAKELGYNGVYVFKNDGSIILIDSTMTRPNGIAMSSDNKTLYVANSDKTKALWMEYRLDEDLQVISKSIFADKTSLLEKLVGLPDGLKIQDTGMIFATGPGGVLIFHPDGRHLGTIHTGKATANCAFDDNFEYLYMTAHDVLMRLKLK